MIFSLWNLIAVHYNKLLELSKKKKEKENITLQEKILNVTKINNIPDKEFKLIII